MTVVRRRRRQQQGLLERVLTQWNDFDVMKLFARKRAPTEPRTVYVNQALPQDAFDKRGNLTKDYVYATNQVLTSKYTIVTFLPRNLFEQFRRVANVFFLGISILQFFPKFSTISPGLVLLPLLVVLSLAAIKDGYEDIKRHQSDRRVNNTHTYVLAGGNYTNQNGTELKSKTFVRGLTAFARKRLRRNRPAVDEKMIEEEKEIPIQSDNTVVAPSPSSSTGSPDGSAGDDNFDADSGRAYWKEINWEDVRVGDIVRIEDDETFPADLVICATSEDENVAFVETKNLDGETNLKSRHAVDELSHLRSARDCEDPQNAFKIHAEAPSVNMYKLSAAVELHDGKQYPIDPQTVLLRGTTLRNTKWIIGCVMYTGNDSKIVMNSGDPPSKRSKVERQMNLQVFFNLTLLGVISVLCAVTESILERRGSRRGDPWFDGDNRKDDNPTVNGLVTLGNGVITFQNVVPISLYVSIELVRTLQAAWIYFDFELWYQKTDTPALARSWNLSDDLGQIEYVFSDKTGTLTQNVMVFRQCSVGGRTYKGDEHENHPTGHSMEPSGYSAASHGGYRGASVTQLETLEEHELQPVEAVADSEGVEGHFKDSALAADLKEAADSTSEHARMLNGFFSCIALCHSALASVDPETRAISYKAQSPDEAALVQAAADVGFVFLGRERETIQIQTPFEAEKQEWELLNMLDFTSARKRMSVIVRRLDDDAKIILFTKGADNVVFERLAPGKDDLRKLTEGHLEDFASEGLRTLCLAYKIIPSEEYEAWASRYHAATVEIDDRERKVEDVSDEIERDLRLLGATGIEDRLQDGVPLAIAHLKRAGIKVWVATGDKLETAISIGYSTNLIAHDSNLIVVRDGHPYGQSRSTYDQLRAAVEQFFPSEGILEMDVVQPGEHDMEDDGPPRIASRRMSSASGYSHLVGDNNGERPGGFVLVIDGQSLNQAFRDEEEFTLELLLQLSTRCEAVVCCRVSPLQKAQMVNLVKDGLGAMTLAIGDGANDVSMIQAADVGVGIIGEEGLQAVNASDYAIAQFRFLVRLLLVHGHWSYYRNGSMIVNFFYKNLVCIGVLFWFQIYCQWSTTYVFEYTYLLLWNIFWTLAPVIAIGLFDRLIDDDILMAIPELYHYGREKAWYGNGLFLIFVLDAVYQSAIIFFIILYTYVTTTAREDGFEVGMYEFSTIMVLGCVLSVSGFNGLNINAWTWWVVFAVFIGPGILWGFVGIYSLISPGWFFSYSYGNYYYLFRAAYLWLSLPLVFVLSLAPRYLSKALKAMFWPNDIDILRAVRKYQPTRDIPNDPQIGGHWNNLYHLQYQSQHSVSSIPPPRAMPTASRPSIRSIVGSRTDMATGLRSSTRTGFQHDFEEGGYAMRRMATNLSERRLQQLRGPEDPDSRRFSIRNSIRRNFPGRSSA